MDASKALLLFTVEADMQTWLLVHGYLCLALRHPNATGQSRADMVTFVRELGRVFVETGLLTLEEMRLMQQVEEQESPHRDRFI